MFTGCFYGLPGLHSELRRRDSRSCSHSQDHLIPSLMDGDIEAPWGSGLCPRSQARNGYRWGWNPGSLPPEPVCWAGGTAHSLPKDNQCSAVVITIIPVTSTIIVSPFPWVTPELFPSCFRQGKSEMGFYEFAYLNLHMYWLIQWFLVYLQSCSTIITT